ncbi:MAG TPA: glycoside hydrolase family 3 C-terminal domain-containing protein [Solirubrobacteraceae bacterium]|jgi:beta-glucosidase|nr:glycoside hydrolase family 3 C-terminal domain-containing protein [Solirubrobacteraceae bacterium]
MSIRSLLTAATAAAALAVLTAAPATAASCPWMNRSLSASHRASLLLAHMSLTQKVDMTYQRYPLDYHYGAAGYIPGVSSLCIPDLVFNDAGQGVGDGQSGTTAFPAPIAQASSWNPTLQYQFGAALGNEAWSKGIDVQLAPGIETDRVPTNGRNWEYMSEDPFLSGQGGAAEVRGIQSQHVIVTLKHFIANSQETDRMTDSSDVSKRTLEEIYAPQYDTAIKGGGAMGVMCSYNRINSVYSCQNRSTLGGILDRQFGFPGFVVSDWGATHSTVPAAKAGLDIEMNVSPGTYYGPAVQTAIQKGQLRMRTLNGMVRRILRAMFRVGVFNHPPAAQPQAYSNPVSTPAHLELARRISEDGSVLLKNRDRVLPITGSGRTIALIGPAAGQAGAENEYNGEGSGHIPEAGITPDVVSPQTGITQRGAASGDTVLYVDGSSTADAVAAAKVASLAVVVVGDSESEGIDRKNLTLTGGTCTLGGCTPQTIDQNQLIDQVAAANPNTVVVLDTGGPVLMPWLGRVRGLLEAWYPGQQDGNALAALLFGDVDPSGHLTETFPASESRMPIRSAAQWPGVTKTGDQVGPHSRYSEGLLVGYRWFQARHVTPLFPFGYGLSYTSFRFSRLRTSSTRHGVVVNYVLKNTGHRQGADVTQVYVGDPRSAGEPFRQLKGFRKITLAPGHSSHVRIWLPEVAFAHWSTRARTWVVARGGYRIYVGDSSALTSLPLRMHVFRGSRRLKAGVY